MPHIRLYVTLPLTTNQSLELPLAQTHYLCNVMRAKVGTQIMLFNGTDGLWQATLTTATHKSATLHIDTCLSPQTTEPDIWLCFAPIKPTPLQVLIQKATELGVSALHPVHTQHTVVNRLSHERLLSTCIEAAEQSRRLTLPVLHPLTPLTTLLADWDEKRTLILCDESGHGTPIFETLQALPPQKPLAILIGPEGGFSASEFELLYQRPYIKPVSMGPRILRADTAGISALACCMSILGDWHNRPAY